jgi:hypothetical protein
MYVPSERAKYLQEGRPFGEATHNKFPPLAKDIADASTCLGVGLPTAAVFHLMRVMEYGIRRLAKRLRVPPKKVRRQTWDTILKEINGAITAMATPSLSARKRTLRDRYAEAAVHPNNVRIAWRNPVMHAECTYTAEEAQAILESVKAFTNFLATKVF